MTHEALLALALAVPAAGAALIALLHRRPNLREAVSLAAAALLFGALLALATPVLDGERPALRLIEVLPPLAIALELEPLGLLFALIASGLWFVSTIYSIGYMRGNRESHQGRFFACFALAIGCAIGVALAGNLLTLYLFYEALTLVTYPLVTHHGDEEARRGGRTYLALLLASSILFLLPAMAVTWSLAGTLDFTPGGLLATKVSGPGAALLLALYAFGIGKAALMPIHRWLPAAMVAPTPVSALLHAVAVVKAGVFSLVKVVVYVFGTGFNADAFSWLPWVAGFTILAASVVALRSDNLKRRLAYSTVSHLSYVVLAAAILAPHSLTGAALHIAAHAFSKITLFFAAGSIYTAAHKTEVSQLDGIGRRMPITMAAFTVGALSLIGIPPFVGFLGKWFILLGALESQHWFAVTVLFVGTLLSAGYLLPVVYVAFFRPVPQEGAHRTYGEAPAPIVIALSLSAAGTVLLFFFPEKAFALAQALAGIAARN
jgi:multicomponent Na+:H+ antiporter subunit D